MNYGGFYEEPKPIAQKPKKISQLVADNGLSYPFVVMKVIVDPSCVGTVVLPINTKVTVTGKSAPTFSDPSKNIYLGYIERDKYQIYDSAVWVLAEASGDNVLSLSAYKKFRDSKRKNKK